MTDRSRKKIVVLTSLLWVAAAMIFVRSLPIPSDVGWLDVTVFLILAVLSERWYVSISEESGMSLSFTVHFAAAVLSHMAPGSNLVLVASLAGLVGNYGYAAYNASKFGVVGLASALRIECKPRGIDVTVVCPPEVVTPMVLEERKTASPVSMATKDFAGVVELDELCNDILLGASRGKWMIVTGFKARLTRFLARMFPGLMNRITDRMVADALRRHGG